MQIRRRLLLLVVLVGLLATIPMVLAAQDEPQQGATAFLVNDAATAANADDLVTVGDGLPAWSSRQMAV